MISSGMSIFILRGTRFEWVVDESAAGEAAGDDSAFFAEHVAGVDDAYGSPAVFADFVFVVIFFHEVSNPFASSVF